MRGRLPKQVWALIIIFVPIVGPAAWLLLTWVRAREAEAGADTDDIVESLRERLTRAAEEARENAARNGTETGVRDVFGRFRGRKNTENTPQRPTTPDDDPEFLWRIQREVYLEKQRRAQQQKREPGAVKDQEDTSEEADEAGEN